MYNSYSALNLLGGMLYTVILLQALFPFESKTA